MDETKETKQDSLQEHGKAPTGEAGNTPKAEVYTKAQVDEMLQKDRIERGRDAKTMADKEAALKAQEDSIKAKQAEIDEQERLRDQADLEAARGDPGKLAAYQARKAKQQEAKTLAEGKTQLKKDREELERDKAQHKADIEFAKNTLWEIKLWQIGEEFDINPVILKKLNLPNEEEARKIAAELKEAKQPTKIITPDSGVTSGRQTSPKGDAALADFFRDKK